MVRKFPTLTFAIEFGQLLSNETQLAKNAFLFAISATAVSKKRNLPGDTPENGGGRGEGSGVRCSRKLAISGRQARCTWGRRAEGKVHSQSKNNGTRNRKVYFLEHAVMVSTSSLMGDG